MKTILSTLCCFLLINISNAQQPPDSLYIVTYTTGSSWDQSKKPSDQIFFKEHSAHLMSLIKNGTAKVGARYAEKGMIIITAKDLQTAKEIIESDQAISNQLFNADIQKLNVFYEGCIEKPKPKN